MDSIIEEFAKLSLEYALIILFIMEKIYAYSVYRGGSVRLANFLFKMTNLQA